MFLRRWITAVQRYQTVGFAVFFAVVGVIIVVTSKAADGPSVGAEAETYVSAQGVTSIADAAVSGGNYVKFGAGGGGGNLASSVTQYGITWSFDKQYTVGQFANGDWWVHGPVQITAISPDFTGTRNGWEANPNSASLQGLDDRLEGFVASRVPNLPYTATAGKSIIKGVSKSGTCGNDGQYHYPCLTTAAVLTVLGSVPTNDGQDVFRPPFFGTNKPQFTTTQLQTNILPSFAPVANTPSLAQVARRYQRVQVDYGNTWYGRYMHASDNYAYQDNPANDNVSEYGAEIGIDADIVALRLMLNDTVAAKTPALINYVQAGIDMYGMHSGGVTWTSDGGHFLGRKLPAVFAATILNDASMKNEIANAQYGSYGDDGHAYYTTTPATVAALAAQGYGPALFGKPCDVGEYEQNQINDAGPRDCRDPIGMIDGGQAPGDSYQFCCITKPLKGASLAARLLPGAKTVWNYQPLHDYIDRWVGFGAWASPDTWNSQGKTPARNYTSLHGTNKDGGWYNDAFVDNMWTAYRGQAQ